MKMNLFKTTQEKIVNPTEINSIKLLSKTNQDSIQTTVTFKGNLQNKTKEIQETKTKFNHQINLLILNKEKQHKKSRNRNRKIKID